MHFNLAASSSSYSEPPLPLHPRNSGFLGQRNRRGNNGKANVAAKVYAPRTWPNDSEKGARRKSTADQKQHLYGTLTGRAFHLRVICAGQLCFIAKKNKSSNVSLKFCLSNSKSPAQLIFPFTGETIRCPDQWISCIFHFAFFFPAPRHLVNIYSRLAFPFPLGHLPGGLTM